MWRTRPGWASPETLGRWSESLTAVGPSLARGISNFGFLLLQRSAVTIPPLKRVFLRVLSVLVVFRETERKTRLMFGLGFPKNGSA